MSRSVWKGPFVDPSLLKKVEKLKGQTIPRPLKLGREKAQSYQSLLVTVSLSTMVKNLFL